MKGQIQSGNESNQSQQSAQNQPTVQKKESAEVIQNKLANAIPSPQSELPPIQTKQSGLTPYQSPAGQKPTYQAKQRPVQRNTGNGKSSGNVDEAQVKANVSNIMGVDVTQAQVHYNSSKPAQLKAEAYAQGNTVEIAPGKEKHLGHELAHIAQQAQGRVQPTIQGNNGIGINNDPKLEKEADEIGDQAMSMKPTQLKQNSTMKSSVSNTQQGAPVQGKFEYDNGVQMSEKAIKHIAKMLQHKPGFNEFIKNSKYKQIVHFEDWIYSMEDKMDKRVWENIQYYVFTQDKERIKSPYQTEQEQINYERIRDKRTIKKGGLYKEIEGDYKVHVYLPISQEAISAVVQIMENSKKPLAAQRYLKMAQSKNEIIDHDEESWLTTLTSGSKSNTVLDLAQEMIEAQNIGKVLDNLLDKESKRLKRNVKVFFKELDNSFKHLGEQEKKEAILDYIEENYQVFRNGYLLPNQLPDKLDISPKELRAPKKSSSKSRNQVNRGKKAKHYVKRKYKSLNKLQQTAEYKLLETEDDKGPQRQQLFNQLAKKQFVKSKKKVAEKTLQELLVEVYAQIPLNSKVKGERIIEEMQKLTKLKNFQWNGSKTISQKNWESYSSDEMDETNCWNAVLYAAHNANLVTRDQINSYNYPIVKDGSSKAGINTSVPVKTKLALGFINSSPVKFPVEIASNARGKVLADLNIEDHKKRKTQMVDELQKVYKQIPRGDVIVLGSSGMHVCLSLGNGQIMELDDKTTSTMTTDPQTNEQVVTTTKPQNEVGTADLMSLKYLQRDANFINMDGIFWGPFPEQKRKM